MLKVKVNLDEKSYTKLLNDMSIFKILKKDGSINKNKFMNLLFANYYQEDQNITKRIIDKANVVLKKYEIQNLSLSHDLANEIYETEFLSSDEQYNKSLTFYLDDQNEFIFNNINTGMFYQTASAYFRNLITRYLMLPEYKRECIIYLNVVEKIQTAIKNKNLITLELDKRIFQFAPYKITTTKEELYSYLVGYDRDRISVIHISKIKNIMIENKTAHFTEEQKQILELNIEKGVQFAENPLCHAVIELTERGVKMFHQRYLHRPTPTEVNENQYTFDCSFTQLFFYFVAFGGEIKVLEPKALANKIYSEYKSYIRKYHQTKEKAKI